MKELLAGPFCGEFGWEICTWVPYLRHIAQGYDKVTVVCNPSHNYLYVDFCSTFQYWEYKAKHGGDNWVFDRYPTVQPFMPKELRKEHPKARVKVPNRARCMSKKKKAFYQYGVDFGKRSFLVVHARATKKYGQGDRNWSKGKWAQLAASISGYSGEKIVSIGTKRGALHVPGTTDMRGMSLLQTAAYLRNAVVVIGTSSGPMHLASHCGAPHVVLTGKEPQKALGGKTNRWRYEEGWSPFKTPCTVIDKYGWQPPVDVVLEAVRGYL